MQIIMPLKPPSSSALGDALPGLQASQADEMPPPTLGRTKEFGIISIPSTKEHAPQQAVKKEHSDGAG